MRLTFLWHVAQRCCWAALTISSSILSKTSKPPSSKVHRGAALCLMSLLFCSDLPALKLHASTLVQLWQRLEVCHKIYVHCA